MFTFRHKRHAKVGATETSLSLRATSKILKDRKFPLWIMSVKRLLELYHRKNKILECHQVLRDQGDVIRYQSLSSDSPIIFVSHEWVDYAHPDPTGYQLDVLCEILYKLKTNKIFMTHCDTKDYFNFESHKMMNAKEWACFLEKAYIWIDYISLPQIQASGRRDSQTKEKPESDSPKAGEESCASTDTGEYGKTKRTDMRTRLSIQMNLAAESVASYISSSDMVLLLAPEVPFSDQALKRKASGKTASYASFATRGWCLLEIFTAFLCGPRPKDILLVRNSKKAPHWINPNRFLLMKRPGTATFTCCSCNHSFKRGPVRCDREIAYKVLNKCLNERNQDLASGIGNYQERNNTRLLVCLRHWFLRGLEAYDKSDKKKDTRHFSARNPAERLKKELYWTSEDEENGKRTGLDLLKFAVIKNDFKAAKYIVEKIRLKHLPGSRRRKLITGAFRIHMPKHGLNRGATNVMIAMALSETKMVEMLLDAGADPLKFGYNGADGLMMACYFNRFDNVKMWLRRFPDWNLERTDRFAGITALVFSFGAHSSPQKISILKALVSAGANIGTISHANTNILHVVAFNVETDEPEVFRYALSQLPKSELERKMRPRTATLNALRYAACIRLNFVGEEHMSPAQIGFCRVWGMTPLHCAFFAGQTRVATYLYREGADMLAKTDRGDTVLQCAALNGFEEVSDYAIRCELKFGDIDDAHIARRYSHMKNGVSKRSNSNSTEIER
eukprot:g3435.t1